MRPGSACNSNEVPDAEAARPSRGAAQSRTKENEASSAAQQQPAVASRQTRSAAQRKWGAERQQHRQYLCTVREIELERDSRQWERLRRSNGNGDGAATAFGFIFSFSFRVESARAATSTATLTKCVFGHCCARVCQCVRVRSYLCVCVCVSVLRMRRHCAAALRFYRTYKNLSLSPLSLPLSSVHFLALKCDLFA